MLKISKKALIGAFFYTCFVCTLIDSSAATASATCPDLRWLQQTRPASQIHHGTVRWIADGDTLHTEKGDKLRLLHIDTPEMNFGKPTPAEPLAQAAKNKLSQLTPVGSRIFWINDKKKRDKYHRQLVFLFNAKGDFVNAELVKSGMAGALFIMPNVAHWQCIREAEKEARRAGKGIWSNVRYRARPAGRVEANQGFQLVVGNISDISESQRNLWLILDDALSVGIPKKDFHYFEPSMLKFRKGQRLILRGYVYQSHGKKRLKWHHPAQLVESD